MIRTFEKDATQKGINCKQRSKNMYSNTSNQEYMLKVRPQYFTDFTRRLEIAIKPEKRSSNEIHLRAQFTRNTERQ